LKIFPKSLLLSVSSSWILNHFHLSVCEHFRLLIHFSCCLWLTAYIFILIFKLISRVSVFLDSIAVLWIQTRHLMLWLVVIIVASADTRERTEG
jgi:hypothetical protein